MALVWSWGWEINAPREKYQESGWITTSPTKVYTNHSDSVQPLGGTGGGEKCLKLRATATIKTPESYFSISKGWITYYVKVNGLGSASYGIGDNKTLLTIASSGSNNISLKTETSGIWPQSQFKLVGNDGSTVVETLAGTYTTDIWYRIAIKIKKPNNSNACYIEEIYINGERVDSITPGNTEPLLGLSDSIKSIKFHGISYNSTSDDYTLVDHIFVYDDDTDDGSKELYIHGVKPPDNGFQDTASWTDNNDVNFATSGGGAAALDEVGDGNYLKTTSTHPNAILSARYNTSGANFFSEVMAVNQISFNQGSGDLNNINTYKIVLHVANAADILLGELPENVLLTTSGKFVNILIKASDTTAALAALSTNITEVANGDVAGRAFKGLFQVNDGS